MISDNLNNQDLRNLYCIFENVIRSVTSSYRFASIPNSDLVKLINCSLSECQLNNNPNDMYSKNILLKRVLKDNIINYLKSRYQDKEVEYVIKIIESKKNSYFPIRTVQDGLTCLLNIIGFLKEVEFLENYEVQQLLITDRFITRLLDLIIENDYQEIARLKEKNVLVELIIIYKPEISKVEIRKHWHNLFGILYQYESDVILEAINKLPIEYQNILQEVFGINYDTVSRPKNWKQDYEYTINNVIIPLIVNIINNSYFENDKLKNNIQIGNLSLFTLFSIYPFDLVLYIINSLTENNKKILQAKFGVNYNEVLFDDNWTKKYSKTCYEVIIPYIEKKAKELIDKNVTIIHNDLLSIFANYESFLVISAINDLTEFEIKYLQSIYGNNYNEVLINIPLNNTEFLNIIFERICFFIQTNRFTYEEEHSETSLLTLLSVYNQESVKKVLDSLSNVDKAKLQKRYGNNYNEIHYDVNKQIKKEIKNQLIPKIIKRILKLDDENISLTDGNNLLNMQGIQNSIIYKELVTYLSNEEAIVIILKFIGFKGRYFSFEIIAKILNISVLEVSNIFNTAIEKYKKHKKNNVRKLTI